MRTVHKFPLALGRTVVDVPESADVVHVDMHGWELTAWIDLDTDEVRQQRIIGVFGTEQSIPKAAMHLGTVIVPGYVWHVYEVDPA